jgi:hypothetical protein
LIEAATLSRLAGDGENSMTGREAVMRAFDRLFDRAAAKLRIQCSEEEKEEAKRSFADRFSAALDIAGQVEAPELPEEVMQTMEEAIDHLSPAQVVGYLAAIPLAHQTQEMLRTLAYRAAEQRLLEHFIAQADDTYGGN